MRWSDVLLPLTPLYGAVVRGRAAAYGSGLLRARRLTVPVVSVGNLTFGGTGKTPTVIALVRDLVRRGRRPAVLTRGYGRRRGDPLVLVGPDPGVGPEHAGDEPLEMARRLPGVPIVIDPNRAAGGAAAVRAGCDIVVLDDGFQHLQLARDLDLVVVDAGDPWGGGRLPPRGRLREPRSAIRRADAVLVSKLPDDHAALLEDIERQIAELAAPLPVLGARLIASRVRQVGGWGAADLLAGRRVVAFAGVGRPQGFVDLLEAAGAEVVATCWFSDHHTYRAGEVDRVVAAAGREDAVPVTTAKDAVRLPIDTPVWVVEADMVPVGGSWDELWRMLPEAAS